MTENVLVTGAFGLVGTVTVNRLVANGHGVIATDLGTAANRKSAHRLPAGAQAVWADLTDANQVRDLLATVVPTTIIHLAGVIPPQIYRNRALSRKVNVTATQTLAAESERLSTPPRFVQASSNAVHGSRNPHRHLDRLSPDSPEHPTDLYGSHKLDAERCVRASSMDWVVLRLGGVFSANPWAMPFSADTLFFESALPTDGRIHGVDVRDVATAFTAACTADVAGNVFMVGGDDSYLLRYGEVGPALTSALGLGDVLPHGRPGNPDNDHDWFVTDWMDTGPAQEALNYQQHSWPQLLEEMRAEAGPLAQYLGLIGPLARLVLSWRRAYRGKPGVYADPWGAFRERFGEPGPQSLPDSPR